MDGEEHKVVWPDKNLLQDVYDCNTDLILKLHTHFYFLQSGV